MQCRKCKYPLWNLSVPSCPECGEPFDVQSYWFEPGTVVFKCPLCGHRHPGDGPRGMPFDAGRCEGCGQILAIEQMPVEPTDPSNPVAPTHEEMYERRPRSPEARRAWIALAVVVAACILIAVLVFVLSGP